jgi:hypothetical protein
MPRVKMIVYTNDLKMNFLEIFYPNDFSSFYTIRRGYGKIPQSMNMSAANYFSYAGFPTGPYAILSTGGREIMLHDLTLEAVKKIINRTIKIWEKNGFVKIGERKDYT